MYGWCTVYGCCYGCYLQGVVIGGVFGEGKTAGKRTIFPPSLSQRALLVPPNPLHLLLNTHALANSLYTTADVLHCTIWTVLIKTWINTHTHKDWVLYYKQMGFKKVLIKGYAYLLYPSFLTPHPPFKFPKPSNFHLLDIYLFPTWIETWSKKESPWWPEESAPRQRATWYTSTLLAHIVAPCLIMNSGKGSSIKLE